MGDPVTDDGRKVDLPVDIKGYWAARRNHDLYRVASGLARSLFADARSAIDVGCNVAGLICELDWIGRRVASDVQEQLTANWAPVRNVSYVAGDPRKLTFDAPFDLVISTQTAEYVDDPAGFVARLTEMGRGLIVAASYGVPADLLPGSKHAPIGFQTFRDWFPCPLDSWHVVHHPTNRALPHIVGVVKRSHPARRRAGAAAPAASAARAPAAAPTMEAFRKHVLAHLSDLEILLGEIYTALAEGQTGFAMVDGGANRGYHTRRMLDLPGCRKVYAVEADPHLAESLRTSLADRLAAGQPGLVLVARALQDDPRRTEIPWRSSDSHIGRSSIVSDNPERATLWQADASVSYRAETTVPATTIDAMLAGEPGPLPFVKLDLEGADLLALTGATATLHRLRPVVAFENSSRAPEMHGLSVADIAARLAALNYVPMDFLGQPMTEATWFGMFEAFAVPKERADWLSARLRQVTARRMAER